ncbi:formate dehydrogenase accessory sulfurtransferase FdhD [Photobacterium sp. Hal280]
MNDTDNQQSEIPDVNAAPPSPDAFRYVELHDDITPDTPISDCAVLASETALSISYNGISQAVMMVTPGNLEDFVKGFSLSNDIVRSVSEIYDITLTAGCDSHHAEVQISNRAFWSLKKHRRQLTGTSGCGICGVEAIEQALPPLTPLTPVPPPKPACCAIYVRASVMHRQWPAAAVRCTPRCMSMPGGIFSCAGKISAATTRWTN